MHERAWRLPRVFINTQTGKADSRRAEVATLPGPEGKGSSGGGRSEQRDKGDQLSTSEHGEKAGTRHAETRPDSPMRAVRGHGSRKKRPTAPQREHACATEGASGR